MGQGNDSSRLTLARVKELADQIKHIGKRAHEIGANQFDRGFSYAAMCGGLEMTLVHLAGETCGSEGRALVEAAFKSAYATRDATKEPTAEVAL